MLINKRLERLKNRLVFRHTRIRSIHAEEMMVRVMAAARLRNGLRMGDRPNRVRARTDRAMSVASVPNPRR
jgi:hypothetical protein